MIALRSLRLAIVLAAAGMAHTCLAAPTEIDIDIDWNISPAQIKSTCAGAFASARARIAVAGAQTTDPALPRLLLVEAAVADLRDALAAPMLLADLAADETVRNAATPCVEAYATFSADVAADPKVYAVAESAEKQADASVDRQLAKIYVETGRRAGAGLAARDRATLTRLNKQLDALELAYSQGLAADRSSVAISQQESAALPADFVASLKKTAHGYRVPVNRSSYELFMGNMVSAETRRRYLDAFFKVGGAANSHRVEQALGLRRRIARMLGFSSWADFQLDRRMAKTPARALALLNGIDAQLLPKARAEIATLTELKAATGDSTPLTAWDYAYYEQQLEQSRYAVDSKAVRQYFPSDKVVPGVLDLYQHLLGVTFERIEPAKTWAPDVQQYLVRDGTSTKPLAWFYLDLAPRAGKFLPPSSNGLRAGHVLADGRYRLPIATIIGNGPAAAPGQPALFSHKDLVIFFHEFGHLMHDALSTAPYASLHGTRVREDFAEAPSQMLENWMWQPAILKKISRDITTGEPIPDALVAKMIALKYAADGVFWTRQVFFGRYDLALHEAQQAVDPNRVWFDLMPQVTPLPPMRGTIPAASFMPIMAGYDAGYYGYAWSRVLAQDMFTAFETGGIENPDVGKRYRREILEPGGSLEPEQLVTNFLGRAPNADAFERDLRMHH